MIQFANPLALLLLFLVPLLVERRITRAADARSGIAFAAPFDLTKLPKSLRASLSSPLLTTLRVIAAIALIVALARPQLGKHFTETEASGRDIILALDLSGSMQAMDFFIDDKRVNRLEALKSVVREFIQERQGDRIGLVVFGEEAFTQCPLTLDHPVLIEFLDYLEIGIAGQGTAIGNGLAIALKQLKSIDSKSRVVVLVTDGKSNTGALSPREAAQIAKQLDIKIHTVGIGGAGPAPFPVPGFFGGTSLIEKDLEYDEKTLQDVAKETGGEYFNARDLSGLKQVYEQINKLEERIDKTLDYVHYEERFVPFLVAALLLLISEAVLSTTVFLKLP